MKAITLTMIVPMLPEISIDKNNQEKVKLIYQLIQLSILFRNQKELLIRISKRNEAI
jgi:hypothetical protein